MSTTPKSLSWLDLGPWHDEPDWYPLLEICEYWTVTIDGIEWVTDRYMLVRSDLLHGSPTRWQKRATDFPPVAEHVRDTILTTPPAQMGDDTPLWIGPMYLDIAERLDVTPVREGTKWMFRDDTGALLAVVAGARPGGPDTRADAYAHWSDVPLVPGFDLTRARIVLDDLDPSRGTASNWWTAVTLLAKLDALAAQKEAPRD